MKSIPTRPELSGTPKHRVIIADSNALFRRGLRALLTTEPDFEVVGEAATDAEIFSRIGGEQVNVLLVNEDRLAAEREFERLQSACPNLAIISLTATQAADATTGESFRRLSRYCAPADMVRKIREAASPERELADQRADLRALSEASRDAARRDGLTQREQEVIRLLAEGMTVREAAEELNLSSKTVEAHTLNLMRKLAIHDRASLIEYAVTHGMAELPASA